METLQRVEVQRLELESNIAKLRRALNHWRSAELDYEGLKDEFQGLPDAATKQQYIETVDEFAPQTLTQRELMEIIEPSSGMIKPPLQVIGILSKRVDYVSRNINDLVLQIDTLEGKLKIQSGIAESPGIDANLPVAEIIEELDEDGNILSSKIQAQDDSASRVIDVLKKVEADVKPEIRPTILKSEDSNNELVNTQSLIDLKHTKKHSPNDESSGTDTNDESIPETDRQFYSLNRDDTEEEAQLRQDMLSYSLEEVGNIVAELEMHNDDETASENANFNLDGLSDTAEEIEPFDELTSEDEDSEDSEDDEDTDGLSRRTAYSEKYRQKMENLQKRLGINMENVGPSSSTVAEIEKYIEKPSLQEAEKIAKQLPPDMRKRIERPSAKEAARKAAIAREEATKIAAKSNIAPDDTIKTKSKHGKKVTFAADLDIAKEESEQGSKAATITAEDVIERQFGNRVTSQDTKQNKSTRISKFKVDRAVQPPKSPSETPPQSSVNDTQGAKRPQQNGRTLTAELVERPARDNPPAAPDADDFDEELQRRQIAVEHHNLRNRLVHDAGGYVRGGESENWGDALSTPEFVDDETGQVRKVSRFKAARMRN